VEHTLFLHPTPQALVAEGLAQIALARQPDGFRRLLTEPLTTADLL
jgi:hypothetical protein